MRVKFKQKVEKAKGACLHPQNVILNQWFELCISNSKLQAWVAVGLGDGSVEVWDYVQSQKRLAWRAHTGPGAKIKGGD